MENKDKTAYDLEILRKLIKPPLAPAAESRPLDKVKEQTKRKRSRERDER